MIFFFLTKNVSFATFSSNKTDLVLKSRKNVSTNLSKAQNRVKYLYITESEKTGAASPCYNMPDTEFRLHSVIVWFLVHFGQTFYDNVGDIFNTHWDKVLR